MGSRPSQHHSTKKANQSKLYKKEYKSYPVGYVHTIVDNNNNIIGIMIRKRFGICYWAGYAVDHMMTDSRSINFNTQLVLKSGHRIPNNSMECLERITYSGMNFVGFDHCHVNDSKVYSSLDVVEHEVLWLYNELRRINGYDRRVYLRTGDIYDY